MAQPMTDDQRAELLKQAHAEGYRPTQRNGQTHYCRSEPVLGTRFEQTVCLSESQLLDRERSANAAQDALRAHPCAGAGCGTH
jgi:hypothetical protein